MIVAPGTTSQSIDIQIVDDTGLAVTGLVAATLPAISWSLAGPTAATSIALSDLALITTAYTSGGVKERSGGYYRLDLPNTALASAGNVRLIGEATGKHLICEPIVVANLPANVLQWNSSNVSAPATAGIPDVNVKNIVNVAATLDANNALNVSAKYWAGTAIVAASVPVGTAAGAAGGVFIAGTNAATTINGTAAVGATPATAALTLVGGAASTTGGGTAAPGLSATGGAGAATTNGAAAGATYTGGGTTTVSGGSGLVATGTGNLHGVSYVHSGTGFDLNATTTPLTLAKTTNITGFNDIAATAVVSAGAITTNGGAVVTTTNVTNAVVLPAIPANWITNAGIAAGALNGKGDWAQVIRTGTAQGGGASTITLDAGASATNNFYNGLWVVITGNTGAGQVRAIGSYVGSTKVATLTNGQSWVTNPDATSTFALLPTASIENLVWDANSGNHVLPFTFGVSMVNIQSFYSTASHVADAAPTTTTFVTFIANAVDNFYNDQTLVFTSGVLAGQSKIVLSYNGTTKAITLSEPLTSPPANGDTFVLMATHTHPVSQIVSGVWQDILTNGDFGVPGSIGAALVASLGTAVLEGVITKDQALRIILASCANKTNGSPGAAFNVRDIADLKNRIAATVDANGNRTAVVLDGT